MPGHALTILVVDDSPEVVEGLIQTLAAAGLAPRGTTSPEEALEILASGEVRAALVDHLMPGTTGLDLLLHCRDHHPDLPVVVMNDLPTIPGVVQAMKAGATDYLVKPLDPGALERALEDAFSPWPLPGRIPAPAPLPPQADPVPSLVGTSACIRNVKELIRAAARVTSPVFVYGPSGTGKEMVAESIHSLSPRGDGPFVAVNCGALPEGIVESELFGVQKGAFTGASVTRPGLIRGAHGGTLFLDELGEMPLVTQVKLLRVLQKRVIRSVGGLREEPVDVRIIAATNRDPKRAIEERTLREDLYYRLAVIKINLEPLELRPEDILPLSLNIMTRLRDQHQRGPTSLSAEALLALRAHPWPGNVRELENVLDMVFALGRAEDEILPEHLPEGFSPPPDEALPPPTPPGADLFSSPFLAADGGVVPLQEAERVLIQRAMIETQGNKARAARILGISRPYLYRRLQEILGPANGDPEESEVGRRDPEVPEGAGDHCQPADTPPR